MSKFPAIRWHPTTKEAQAFHRQADVPEGYLDHHPDDPAYAETASTKSAAAALTREEVLSALRAGGITFKANSPTTALTEVLVNALKAHLEANQVDFPLDADAKALLALAAPSSS